MKKIIDRFKFSKLAIGILLYGIGAVICWYICGEVKMMLEPELYPYAFHAANAEYSAVSCSFTVLLSVFCDAVMRF
ncbi:MAG TPA: hypothetical protein PLT66_08525 [Bacillota bacterium]|nr:hypothetical protein [Bacillota bacterium]